MTLVHTGDMHGRLTAARACALREVIQAQPPPVLVLDSGDALRTGNVDVRFGGEPVLAHMTELGYAAMCLGNREFHICPSLLCAKLASAEFKVLCANVTHTRQPGLPVMASHVWELPSLRVGVFGLLTPMLRSGSLLGWLCGVTFDEPLAAARRQAAQLREHCDVLIALTHIGLAQDEALFEEVLQVALILGGHSHRLVHHITPGRALVHSGSHARQASVVRWLGEDDPPEIQVVELKG